MAEETDSRYCNLSPLIDANNNFIFSKNGFSSESTENKSDNNGASTSQEDSQEKQLIIDNSDTSKTNDLDKNEKKTGNDQPGTCYW